MPQSDEIAKRYDVALSFAGEDRPYVEQVADYLRSRGARVFYDRYEQTRLWGKHLPEILDQVYRVQSEFVVMFVSLAYRDKEWTRHERRSALAAALKSEREYVLPVRFDKTELDGLPPTVSYLDLGMLPPSGLAEMVLDKLKEHGVRFPDYLVELTSGGYDGWRLLRRGSWAAENPLRGLGSVPYAGRWHQIGDGALYAAPSVCEATLEMLAVLDLDRPPDEFVAIRMHIPEGVGIETVYSDSLPKDWRTRREVTQSIGHAWFVSGQTVMLSVPSAVLPENRVFLLNTKHGDFPRVSVVSSQPITLFGGRGFV